MKRVIVWTAVLWLSVVTMVAQFTGHEPVGNQIPGPGEASGVPGWIAGFRAWQRNPADDFDVWIRDLKMWRSEHLTRMGYDDAEYRRPELAWTQRNFVQPQVMVEERYLYDPESRRYTVDRLLDDFDKRYGGVDSVLLWPVYPNMGIDSRNQWDLHRDMPGGIPALRDLVADFHRRGVKVFFPTMPWDNGTRDVGMLYWEATARLMAEIGADGVNGDTFAGMPRTYQTASVANGHRVAFEPEMAPASDEGLMWNLQSWGYWQYGSTPTASKLKWLEPRHMIHICNRWARDKTDDLQHAFFNGIGYETWENIWGIWNQITPRDAEAIRRITKIERSFAELLVSPQWMPFQPTLRYGVFASVFPGQDRALYTFVNRNEYDVGGPQIQLEYVGGRRYFDLWKGTELKPRIENGKARLEFTIEGRGYGALLALDSGASTGSLADLLKQAHEWARVPLQSLSHEWKVLPQKIVDIPPTKPADSVVQGMVRIPDGEFDFTVSGMEIEGFNWEGLDVQYPWENSPRRSHHQRLSIKSFYIDKFPVTNSEFKRFLESSGYRPTDDHNFLRDWKNGTYQEGWANKPVTWVALEDVRAFAKWAGKRLPHEWEWQYAAQSTDGRTYPWGNHWDTSAVPTPDEGRDVAPPADVDVHPRGASPFGVMDMVGNIWQWTDEFIDDHTRGAVLRGGSHYQPQGALWYFPQAYKLNEHGKYLLMAPSKDRAGTLGFRCVMEAQ